MSRSAGLSVSEIRAFYETETPEVQAAARGVREFFQSATPEVRKVVLGMVREDLQKTVPTRMTTPAKKKQKAVNGPPQVPVVVTTTLPAAQAAVEEG